MTQFLRVIRSAVLVQTIRRLWRRAFPVDASNVYQSWVRARRPSKQALHRQRRLSMTKTQRFSLITFVAAPGEWRHERTAASVLDQSYPVWEWLLVATEDSLSDVQQLATRLVRDDRLRVLSVPSGSTRAQALNHALAAAGGEFAAVLGEHDLLAPNALYEMAAALQASPDSDVLYSDEDRLSADDGARVEPRFKPDWSPELLLAYNYIGRLALLRISSASSVGGFRDVGQAEEWDLLLRLSRTTTRIRRVPLCLYHRATPDAREEEWAEAVLQNHGRALGQQVSVTTSQGVARVTWDVQGQPRVSVIIPNRNAFSVLRHVVEGLRHRTSYPHRELIIVDNGSTDHDVLELYRGFERDGFGRVVSFDRPFNFSAACNVGAAAAQGDLLLFLNNDIEVIHADWLDELVRWAQRPEIGVVGAKLLYPDRTIQHAGVVFGLGLVGHIFSRAAEGASGVFGSTESYRNYLAVTGACQMMRRDVFSQLGGYDERFRLSFSDVVLCMEAWNAGLRVVYTPHARLIHHESYTRKREDSAEDMELLARYLRRCGFAEDRYLHPELNAQSLIPLVRPPSDPAPSQVVKDYVARVLAATGDKESDKSLV